MSTILSALNWDYCVSCYGHYIDLVESDPKMYEIPGDYENLDPELSLSLSLTGLALESESCLRLAEQSHKVVKGKPHEMKSFHSTGLF